MLDQVHFDPDSRLRQAVRRYLNASLPDEVGRRFQVIFKMRYFYEEREVQDKWPLTISDALDIIATHIGLTAAEAEKREADGLEKGIVQPQLYGSNDPADFAHAVDRRILEHRNFSAIYRALTAFGGEGAVTPDEANRHAEALSSAPAVLDEIRRRFAPSGSWEETCGETPVKEYTSVLQFAALRIAKVIELLPGHGR